MNRILPLLSVTCLLGIVMSCNVYKKVTVNGDRSFDYSKYSSYAWLPNSDSTANSEYDNSTIRNNTHHFFNHCMRQREYKVDTLAPDLLFKLEWVNIPKAFDYAQLGSMPTYMEELVDYLWYPGDYSTLDEWDIDYEVKTKEYAYGAIILNIFDRKEKRLLWRGVAEGNIYDADKIYDDLHPAVHRMMKQFPIKPKKRKRP